MSDNTNAPTCPACGVPYGDHMGLHGTCAALADVDHIDAMARRAEAVRCGIDDPDDTPPCLADFADEIIRLRARIAGDRVPCRGFVTSRLTVAFCGRCRNTQTVDPAHSHRARRWLAEVCDWTITDDNAICDECGAEMETR